jgi:hypothetical protein
VVNISDNKTSLSSLLQSAHVDSPGNAPAETPVKTDSGRDRLTFGDSYEVSTPLLRFGQFSDPEARANPRSRFNVDPNGRDFEAQMGAKYQMETFQAWQAIANVLQAFFAQMMANLVAQMIGQMSGGDSGGGGTIGGISGGGGGGSGGVVPGLPTPGPTPSPSPAPVPIADTTPTSQDGYTARTLKDNELFGENGPQAQDIAQGNLGDCYFLSTLGGVATEHPEIIKDNIKEHVDPNTGEVVPHQYDVRFYEQDQHGNTVEHWVTVNDSMLRDSNGNEDYAQTLDNDHDGKWEQWVALYEKGYAVFKSETGDVDQGYDEIGQGGWGGEAYFAITGQQADADNPANMSDQELLDVLNRTNPADGDVVMLGSRGGNDSMLQAEGLPGNHMYQVLGTYTDPDSGEVMVTIRNPWGSFEPGMIPDGHGGFTTNENFDGTNDGIFSVPLSQVQRDFDLVTYASEPTYDVARFRYPEIRS